MGSTSNSNLGFRRGKMFCMRINVAVFVIFGALALSSSANGAAVAENWTTVWTNSAPSNGGFEVIYAVQEGKSVSLMRFWNQPNKPMITTLQTVQLLDTCVIPRWTPTTLWSNGSEASFEVVYALDCGSRVYLIRFWNRAGEPNISVLDSLLISGQPNANDGWGVAPIWTNKNTAGTFEVVYSFQRARKIYLIRFWNKPGAKMMSILAPT